MQKLIEVLREDKSTVNDFISCLKEIEALGDVFILKVDGERSEMQNTVMITFPSSNHEIIRYDSSDLKEALIKALQDYVSVKGIDPPPAILSL